MENPRIARRALGVVLLVALAAACLAPAAAASPADKAQTVTGTVTKVQASQRTVTVALSDGAEAVFTWNPETKINGTLTPGARVTVRYQPGAEASGPNLALQITVARS
ncbi:MAG: hypothetical protein WAU32_00690 [Thermoanaerobaculia bacterium]